MEDFILYNEIGHGVRSTVYKGRKTVSFWQHSNDDFEGKLGIHSDTIVRQNRPLARRAEIRAVPAHLPQLCLESLQVLRNRSRGA